MEIDNFKLFEDWMKISNDEFYFLQVLTRTKDKTENCCNIINRQIKSYNIYSIEQLKKIELEIKMLCAEFHARAYINISARSKEKVAFQMLKDLSETICNKQYVTYNLFDSACGKDTYNTKLYLVDIDTKDELLLESIKKAISESNPHIEDKIKLQVPTVYGYHLICSPFDTRCISDPLVSIHKNGSTLLYFNNSNNV